MIERLVVVVAVVSALLFSISAVALEAVNARHAADQGIQVKQAVCALRAFNESQIRQSQAFLKLTLAERKAKYGSIGDVPDAQIQAGITREEKVVGALSSLNCGG